MNIMTHRECTARSTNLLKKPRRPLRMPKSDANYRFAVLTCFPLAKHICPLPELCGELCYVVYGSLMSFCSSEKNDARESLKTSRALGSIACPIDWSRGPLRGKPFSFASASSFNKPWGCVDPTHLGTRCYSPHNSNTPRKRSAMLISVICDATYDCPILCRLGSISRVTSPQKSVVWKNIQSTALAENYTLFRTMPRWHVHTKP